MADSTSQAEQGFFSRIASDFTTRAWVLIPVGVGINFVGGTLVTVLKLPIFLDTIGTILVALLAGPWVAALTGLITNLVLGVSDPTLIAFAPSLCKYTFTEYSSPARSRVGENSKSMRPGTSAPIALISPPRSMLAARNRTTPS